MQTLGPKTTLVLITIIHLIPFCLNFATTAAAKKTLVPTSNVLQPNATTNSSSSATYSPWLRGFRPNPRFTGCWRRPWICNSGEDFPRIRRRCCRNRCVDVTSDVNNCGLCGIRCPFTRQCCWGLCVNTNINPFHCGRCNHRCRFPSFCFYGMCGYAQPLPPFPFPFPPKPPRPPKPFPPPRPPKPFPPPRPPKPFPPKPWPPKPWPPKGGRRGSPPVGSEVWSSSS